MPTIDTLGIPSKRTTFSYSGSVKKGVVLEYADSPHVTVTKEFFKAILKQFKGETITGGFSMTAPIPGGLGVWIENNSHELNSVKLTPRHASRIAAILWNEKYLHSTWTEGNKVMLKFNDNNVDF
jgi:hypothetical protein